MTLPDSIVIQPGTQIVYADHAGAFAPATKTSLLAGGGTTVQFSPISLGNGLGHEAVKVNLGASRAESFSVSAALEFVATPTSRNVVSMHWAPSPVSAAANGNIMQIDGADVAAPSGVSTLDELIAASQFIGNFQCSDNIAPNVQVSDVGVLFPKEQHGILFIKNDCGAAFHSDSIEMHVVFTPNDRVIID